jgi:hypothetical protein
MRVEQLMDPSESAHVTCPYCGEPLEVAIDASAGAQDYIEDCQVCCRPIQFRLRLSADGDVSVDVRGEDE